MKKVITYFKNLLIALDQLAKHHLWRVPGRNHLGCSAGAKPGKRAYGHKLLKFIGV